MSPLLPSRRTRDAFAYSMMRWTFFGVVLAVVPIGLNAFHAVTRDEENFNVNRLVEQGELLLVASAVLGAALAEMFSQRNPRYRKVRWLATLFAAMVLLAASAGFADVAAGVRSGDHLDDDAVAMASYWVFGLALITGVACVVVASVEEEPD